VITEETCARAAFMAVRTSLGPIRGPGARAAGVPPGVSVRDLVLWLSVFPDPATWSVHLRRASLTLPLADADLVRTELEPLLHPYDEAVAGYRWEAVLA
jgi:hypothetical protein